MHRAPGLSALAALGALLGACEPPRAPLLLGSRQIELALRHAQADSAPVDSTNRVALDAQAARLGQWLFFDTELSRDQRFSCASCHDPARSFADGRSLPEGAGTNARQAPVLWNAAWSRWLQWDGSADTLWSQALRPIESPTEMASSRLRVARRVADNTELRAAYERVFEPLPELLLAALSASSAVDARPLPDAPQASEAQAWAAFAPEQQQAIERVFSNVGKALAAYETRIVARDSPFDRFAAALAADDPRAGLLLARSAQRGLALFVGKADCRRCHSGPNFSDGEFHDIGVPPLSGDRPSDAGRFAGAQRVQADVFNAAGPYSDDPQGERAQQVRQLLASSDTWGQFKTPTLRNVASSAPYMHQGQFADLRRVLEFYSTLAGAVGAGHHREQLLVPLELSPQEIDDLVAFLESLTCVPLPAELLQRPDSP